MYSWGGAWLMEGGACGKQRASASDGVDQQAGSKKMRLGSWLHASLNPRDKPTLCR